MTPFRIGFFIVLGLSGCAHHPTPDAHQEKSKEVLIAHTPELAQCYVTYGEHKPVNLRVKYTAAYTGEVQFAEIDSHKTHISNPDLDDCIVKVVQGLQFPVSETGHGFYGSVPFKYEEK